LNKNIEIINKNLWAVRFSWLPWISDINIELDPSIPVEHEVCRIADNGILILNADNPMFPLYKEQFPIFQKKKTDKLQQKINMLKSLKTRNQGQELYLAIGMIELNCRKKKGGK